MTTAPNEVAAWRPARSHAGDGEARPGTAALLALVALALGLRLPGALGWWFNADEAIYYKVATTSAELARKTIASNAHPPVFYWLLRGVARVSETPFALRLPALVCGVALVPAVASLAGRWFGARAGLWAGAWIAVGTSSVLTSQVMRPYAMLALMLTLALLGLADWMERGGARGLLLHALALAVALGLHYSAFLATSACVAGASVALLLRRAPLRAWLALGAAWALPLAVMVALYLTHVAPRLRGGGLEAEAQTTWLAEHYVGDPLQAAKQLLYGLELVLGWGGAAVPVLLVLAARLARRRGRDEAWLVPLLTLAAAVSASWLGLYPLGGSRHSYHLVPAVTALAAGAVPAIAALSSERWRRAGWALLGLASAASLACTLLLVATNRATVMPAEHSVTNAQAREVTAVLRDDVPRQAVLLADFQTIELLSVILGLPERWFHRREGTPIARRKLGERAVFGLDRGGERVGVIWVQTWLPQRDGSEPDFARLARAVLDDEQLAARAARHGAWLVQSGGDPERLAELQVGAPGSPFLELAGGAGLGALRVDLAAYLEWVAAARD